MKKYNQIIVVSVFVYMVLALGLGNVILNVQEDRDHGYRIESNRIMNEITDLQQLQSIDLSKYTYIQNIEYLDYLETNQEKINQFYLESNKQQIQILPFYQDQQLQGYVKLYYQIPNWNMEKVFLTVEIGLFVLESFIIMVLLYLKRNILLPFQRLVDVPIELSKGHFKKEVKEEKNKYFGKFLWGMSQLQDTLDISNKRQLELLKEKKKMLLSLSHDMKTPLNLIKLYSKALYKDVYLDERSKKQAMKQIDKKADEIEKYVDKIVQSSREDILDLQVENQEFYLTDLINQVLSIYQEQCSLRHIELLVPFFENKLLKGDIERSQEVFENLFENAFKYGDGRQIELSFYEEDYCQLIRFFNTGTPVSDTELNHIFESFYRGANSHGKKGNGLGLYICRELMQKMDGAIFVEKSDQGMAFTLVFRQ